MVHLAIIGKGLNSGFCAMFLMAFFCSFKTRVWLHPVTNHPIIANPLSLFMVVQELCSLQLTSILSCGHA